MKFHWTEWMAVTALVGATCATIYAGLMRAIRNPTAHEPALHWPITEPDAVDILSFISFLFRQLDKAVKHP